MLTRNVSVEARLKLEETLLGRWKAREVNRVLARLEAWVGWSWATEQAILEAVPYLSQPIRARRVREARAQLPAMLRLPPLTPPENVLGLRQRIAFDVLPASALVLPEDRVLSPFHCLAICRRGLPMTQAIARAIGGLTMTPFRALEAEMERQADAQAVRLMQLEARTSRRAREPSGGPACIGFTF